MTDSNAPTSTTTSSSMTDNDDTNTDDATVTEPTTASTENGDAHEDMRSTRGSSQASSDAEAESDPQDAFYASALMEPVSPEASPAGDRLAYLLPTGTGRYELWLSPTDGGEPAQLELPFQPVVDADPDSGRILRGPQWSPDGRTLVLAGISDNKPSSALWLVPVPNAPAAAEPAEAEPAPAGGDVPEFDTATTSADARALDTTEATAADAETEVTDVEAEPVPAPAGGDVPEFDTAATSADARALDTTEATADAAADADTEVTDVEAKPVTAPAEPAWRLEINGPTQLTSPVGQDSDRSPRWAHDGEAIAFVATRGRRDVIALVSVGDAFPAPAGLLTWSDQDDREPVWSRDGQFLAFARKRTDGPGHADIYVYSARTGELKNLTSEKASILRHSLEWVPGRNLVAFVTFENDWLSISVINADNKAGWTVTRETGDKTEPRFARDEARMVYVRTEGFSTVCCERGLHASGSVALDPGEGVATIPRWVGAKRVAYGFSSPQKPFGILVQDNLADAERTSVQLPAEPSVVGMQFRNPVPFEYELGPDEHFSGMIYRTHGLAGAAPAAVYIPDGPLHTRRGEFQAEEQALASTGITVLTPVMHGATGFGEALAADLAEFADTELEASDIAEAGRSLADVGDIAETKIAVVGRGYGGTLALVTAGARPGTFAAVAAIDPITDWGTELAGSSSAWRNWVVRQYGLPFVNQDRYALRTPTTFAAVIDVPIVLVCTVHANASRREQVDAFAQFLDEEGVEYSRIDADDEPIAATMRRVSQHLAKQFFGGNDAGQVVEGVRADELEN